MWRRYSDTSLVLIYVHATLKEDDLRDVWIETACKDVMQIVELQWVSSGLVDPYAHAVQLKHH